MTRTTVVRSLLTATALAAVGAVAWPTGAPRPEPARGPLAAAHREALAALQGATSRVAQGSPELCGAPIPTPATDAALEAWLYGDGGCSLELSARQNPWFTPLSRVDTGPHVGEAWAARIDAALRRLEEAVRDTPPRGRRKLWLQHLAWEVVTNAVELRRSKAAAVQTILERAQRLLAVTRLTEREVEALPTVVELSAVIPDGYVELRGTEAHADVFDGQIFLRIFVGSDVPSTTESLRAVFTSDPVDRRALFSLPSRVPSVHAVVVVALTALDGDGRIRPTNQIIAVRDVRFGVPGGSTLSSRWERVAFNSVDFLADLDSEAVYAEPTPGPRRPIRASSRRFPRSTAIAGSRTTPRALRAIERR